MKSTGGETKHVRKAGSVEIYIMLVEVHVVVKVFAPFSIVLMFEINSEANRQHCSVQHYLLPIS